MAFYCNHQCWNRQQWGTVVFRDEFHFTLLNFDGFRCVWRRLNKSITDVCVQEHNHYCRGSVRVSDGFHETVRAPVYQIKVNLTAIWHRNGFLIHLVIPTQCAVNPGTMSKTITHLLVPSGWSGMRCSTRRLSPCVGLPILLIWYP